MATRAPLNLALGLGAALLAAAAPPAAGFTIELSAADFGLTPTFSNVRNFTFSIDVDAPLAPGPYVDPALALVDYRVNGSLASGTPSGFPAFALVRTIPGNEFYAQGSSLRFEIASGADLSDGLQVSELAGSDPVFVLDAREVDTGRYHPPLFQLNADGTGSIRNSNNTGGVNPATGRVVDVDFGEEYVTELGFVPGEPTLVVPEPSSAALLAAGLLATAARRRLRLSRRSDPSRRARGCRWVSAVRNGCEFVSGELLSVTREYRSPWNVTARTNPVETRREGPGSVE